jgi:cyclopropane-fatty-acyl-phospholipid synthase
VPTLRLGPDLHRLPRLLDRLIPPRRDRGPFRGAPAAGFFTVLDRAAAMAADGVAKRRVLQLLETAGVEVGGSRPHDVVVHDERTYSRFARDGALGVGEAYMDGWWDAPRLDALAHRLVATVGHPRPALPDLMLRLRARLVNRQKPSRAFKVGTHHYDIGNDLYERMLDRRMVYSCGYWKDASSLDAAQEAKLDLVCRKLGLEPGMEVLDIGCGWGSFAAFAAERYGAHVTGITVSREQAALAEQRCAGLPVDVQVRDYRTIAGDPARYDRIVSIGMLEHVGWKNYRRYMQAAHGVLRDGGLMLLHSITVPRSQVATDAWTERYIFPNSMLPSLAQLGKAADGLFLLEDLHGFGADYDPTLLAWNGNVERHWGELAPTYGERFRRMWRYYLLTSAGSFRARALQVWQMVLAKDRGVPGGYVPVR